MGNYFVNVFAFTLAIVFLVLISTSESVYICNIKCDSDSTNENLKHVNSFRQVVSKRMASPNLILYISDEDNMAYGKVLGGEDRNTTIWLERSFDGGLRNYEGPLGETSYKKTKAFNIDDPAADKIGAVRICGKLSAEPFQVFCTEWARSKVNSETPIDAAATALMQFYNEAGTFKTTNWWNSANALVSIINYLKVTKKDTYEYAIDFTFEENKAARFVNDYIDDTLWWGLAWVEAYDYLGDEKYLHMAKFDANHAAKYIDEVCKGGVWWTERKTYKNAVTNELLIKLSAALHNRIPGDTKYLQLAQKTWTWFKASGMINQKNLINDGLTDDCKNNVGIMWTYNQGVILGALVQLNEATGDKYFLEEAVNIAYAVLNSTKLNPDGVLQDYGCESVGRTCDADQTSFKGIFIRNLAELDRVLEERPFKIWIQKQADTIQIKNRNSLNQYGVHWKGPFDKADAARQHSALDALNAAAVD